MFIAIEIVYIIDVFELKTKNATDIDTGVLIKKLLQ
jgi:hypothetical protein